MRTYYADCLFTVERVFHDGLMTKKNLHVLRWFVEKRRTLFEDFMIRENILC